VRLGEAAPDMRVKMPRGVRAKVNERVARLRVDCSTLQSFRSKSKRCCIWIERRAAALIADVTRDDTSRPGIHFGFIDDRRFNARGMFVDPDSVILVTEGAIAALPALYRNLFSLPRFATHLGQASLERELEARHLSVITSAGLPELMRANQRMPNCPDRQAMAVLLARTALDFLVLQELGHIRNGHLGFLSGRTPTEMLETEVLAETKRRASAPHVGDGRRFTCCRAHC
jgi:hypothetical protein